MDGRRYAPLDDVAGAYLGRVHLLTAKEVPCCILHGLDEDRMGDSQLIVLGEDRCHAVAGEVFQRYLNGVASMKWFGTTVSQIGSTTSASLKSKRLLLFCATAGMMIKSFITLNDFVG